MRKQKHPCTVIAFKHVGVRICNRCSYLFLSNYIAQIDKNSQRFKKAK